MDLIQAPAGANCVITPHPVTLDGQRHVVAQLLPGEKLGPFLARTVPDWAGDMWEVRINGVLVPVEILDHVRPKEGALIEVRGVVRKQVLAIVAIAALAYFTLGTGLAFGAGMFATGTVGASVLNAVVFAAGSALINKVLGPKPAKPAAESDPVYSIGSARNTIRPYEPLALLFGSTRIAPDVASMPYSWYEGNDQYLGMVLTPGTNVHSVEALYNGDTLLSSYEGVSVYYNGLPGHPDQSIPLYSNADTIAGGDIEHDGTWMVRGTPIDTVRIQLNLEYMLGGTGTSGKDYDVRERIVAEYRPVGGGAWTTLADRTFVGRKIEQRRATMSADVARGQYEVRTRMMGIGNYTGANTHYNDFSLVTITAVQADNTDYTGIPRIGIRIKATGQLNGALDEVRCVAKSLPIPVWKGAAWVTEHSSNPGAMLLAYARGIYDANGRILAGIGLPDSMIDIPALQAFTVHCAVNNYTYDCWIKDARNHQEMVDAIALTGLGQSSWAGGKFGVVWADSAQPLTGVVNMATMKKGSFQVDYTLANAADGIEYTYVDPSTWQPVTLRVQAPGVVTMQNPARVTGEGITTEAHAAKMARFFLAQHLYQYKDISFSTDLEHLTYRRMSLLALSHDMTQWGHGGRLRGAVNNAGVVTVHLDESVPSLPSRYIGLRVPGETVYRVFGVQAFSGESDTLTLVGSWPAGVDFPGSDDDNPAHDTIWIYDIKATPGYRVRVVQVEPESNLEGARVAVVPESPEYWAYVNTGAYTPPTNQSLLQGRPVASGLSVSESQVTQGNTIFTELLATFDVSGALDHSTIHMARNLDGVWGDSVQVAETRAQQARFRIDGPGQYRVTVRPFDASGNLGGVASVEYSTVVAGESPPSFDTLDVVELDGGVRRYSWGYASTTVQPTNLAGAEIRYIAGDIDTPDWDAMTPVGEGFHTTTFEAVVPPAGTWTFAARARNTDGLLSAPIVTTTGLAENLVEQINNIEDDATDLANALAAEALERFEADAAVAAAAAADATAKANAARDAAIAHADVIGAQVADILEADEWNSTDTYPEGDLVQYAGKLYRALTENTNQQPDTNPDDWQFIGNYASLGEAVAASISMGTQNASDIDAVSTQLDVVVARMPAGSGELATSASVASEASARVAGDAAAASRLDVVEARMPAGSGQLATATALNALDARVTSAEGTLTTQASALTALQAGTNGRGVNIMPDHYSTFEAASLPAMTAPSGGTVTRDTTYKAITAGVRFAAPVNYALYFGGPMSIKLTPGKKYIVSYWLRSAMAGNGISPFIETEGAAYYYGADTTVTVANVMQRKSVIIDTSANTSVNAWFGFIKRGGNEDVTIDGIQIEELVGTTATPSAYSRGTTGTQTSANTTAITLLDARVTSAEGTLTSQASQITSLNSAVAGKAEASALTALTTRVSSVEGQGYGVNILPNSMMLPDATLWTYANPGLGWSNPTTNHAGDSWVPPGMRNWGVNHSATPTTGQYVNLYSPRAPVTQGQWYFASVYAATHRGRAQLFVEWTDEANNVLAYTSGPIVTEADGFGGVVLSNWARPSVAALAPTGARFARVIVQASGNGAGVTPYVWMLRPMLEQARSTQANPSPWNSGGMEAQAAYTLRLDVNGYVTGWNFTNNGTQGNFDILTDYFRLLAPGGGARLEASGGNFRAYDAAGTLRARFGTW